MLRDRDGRRDVLLLLGWWSRSVGGDSSRRMDILGSGLRWGWIPGELSNID